MKSSFKHPQIYADLLAFYKMYWQIHKHLPKSFRLTTGETVLAECTECLRNVLLANSINKAMGQERTIASQQLQAARSSLAVIKGLLTLGWSLTFISHGALANLIEKLDTIEKQAVRWQQWFQQTSYTPKEGKVL